MTKPPFSKSGAVVLALAGAAIQASADTPAPTIVPPTILHQRGTANYIPAPGGPARFVIPPGVVGPGSPEARPPFILPPQAPLPKPKPEDAKKLLDVLNLQKTCKLPLDLTVEKANLEEIVAQIAKTLGEKAPRIEVHDELPIRLSFALKDSTLREALETTGGLAGVQLWVLSDHLLLAPRTALTLDESSAVGGTSTQDMQRVFASLLADELAGKSGGTAPTATEGILPSAKTTFDKLSPEGKKMLQGLVENSNEFNRTRLAAQASDANTLALHAPLTLTPNTIVELNPNGNTPRHNGVPVDSLSITQENRGMNWATNGGSWGSSYQHPRPPKSGSATAPPLFDPSAKKS